MNNPGIQWALNEIKTRYGLPVKDLSDLHHLTVGNIVVIYDHDGENVSIAAYELDGKQYSAQQLEVLGIPYPTELEVEELLSPTKEEREHFNPWNFIKPQ